MQQTLQGNVFDDLTRTVTTSVSAVNTALWIENHKMELAAGALAVLILTSGAVAWIVANKRR